jgi:tRNA (cmo5U34)-methyltransferase
MGKFDGRQADYIEGARRNVPGLGSLHRMTALLLAENVPANGRLLVVGAGGGLELKALTEQHPGWTFDGVDPSSDMLELARETTASTADRIDLHLGEVSAAPSGPRSSTTPSAFGVGSPCVNNHVPSMIGLGRVQSFASRQQET